MTQLRKLHAHMTSICFSVPASEKSPIVLKYLRFSAQISGFSADFHRKSLDIVKRHPNNAKIACFSPVTKVYIGEHKFDGTGSEKKWELENGKKSGFWQPKK